eukprot:TRINITY_DN4065_c0_g1_i1.p1 TRINITY_DN4065_c0_g1~~TRINITY_DN4065_c0_g1_i1.p1  ORF type:complete len:275 (+),score=56.13 TRINITY_DN4065_c0_g1_i1:423-1247(+)
MTLKTVQECVENLLLPFALQRYVMKICGNSDKLSGILHYLEIYVLNRFARVCKRSDRDLVFVDIFRLLSISFFPTLQMSEVDEENKKKMCDLWKVIFEMEQGGSVFDDGRSLEEEKDLFTRHLEKRNFSQAHVSLREIKSMTNVGSPGNWKESQTYYEKLRNSLITAEISFYKTYPRPLLLDWKDHVEVNLRFLQFFAAGTYVPLGDTRAYLQIKEMDFEVRENDCGTDLIFSDYYKSKLTSLRKIFENPLFGKNFTIPENVVDLMNQIETEYT